MKYIKTLLITLALIPSISFGAFPVGWNATSTSQGWILPNLINGINPIPVAYRFIASFFTATSTTATSTLPNVSSNNLSALTSSGLDFHSNNGTAIADFGAGGGSNASFFGGVNIDGTTRLATSLSGLLKATAGTVSTAINGTDYTLIASTTCSGTDKVSAISATGVITCSTDQSGSGSSSVGAINTLQASNGSGGFIATGTPQLTIGNFIATSSTATSQIGGSLFAGIPALAGLGTTNSQLQISQNVNNLTRQLDLANTNMGTNAATSLTFLNGNSTNAGASSQYIAGLVFGGPNFSLAGFSGLRPNGFALYNTDGGIDIGATSANSASSTVNFYAGNNGGFAGGSPDLTLTVSGGASAVGMPHLGLGTTTPWGKFSINNYSSGISTRPLFVIASSTGTAATTTSFIVNNIGNVGIGSTTPGSLLAIGTTNGINFTTATTSFSSTGGINIASGCFAIAGVCISGGGGGGGGGSVNSVSGTYPVQSTGGANPVISLAFGTTTENTWALNQLFTSKVGLGSTTPWAVLAISTSSTDQPHFDISTSTDASGQMFRIVDMVADSFGNIFSNAVSGVRVFIGQAVSTIHNLYINGTFASSYENIFCDSMKLISNLSVDTYGICGDAVYDEGSNGQFNTIAVGSAQGFDGGSLLINSGTVADFSRLHVGSIDLRQLASTTPKMEVIIGTTGAALSTTTGIYSGWFNIATGTLPPTLGCGIVSTSTPNFQAMCVDTGVATLVDTGIATSTPIKMFRMQYGPSQFKVEAKTTPTAEFATVATITSNINTTSATYVLATPLAMTRIAGGTAIAPQIAIYGFRYFKYSPWWGNN